MSEEKPNPPKSLNLDKWVERIEAEIESKGAINGESLEKIFEELAAEILEIVQNTDQIFLMITAVIEKIARQFLPDDETQKKEEMERWLHGKVIKAILKMEHQTLLETNAAWEEANEAVVRSIEEWKEAQKVRRKAERERKVIMLIPGIIILLLGVRGGIRHLFSETDTGPIDVENGSVRRGIVEEGLIEERHCDETQTRTRILISLEETKIPGTTTMIVVSDHWAPQNSTQAWSEWGDINGFNPGTTAEVEEHQVPILNGSRQDVEKQWLKSAPNTACP